MLHIKPLLIVFTDLDGTLLDHQTYDYAPARTAMQRLKKNALPLIPTTSKTLDEIDNLGIEFGAVPKIGENGMVAEVPDGFLPPPDDQAKRFALGRPYSEVLTFLENLPPEILQNISGFSMMDTREIMCHTGLSQERAALAGARLGSEPFLWAGDDALLEQFHRKAAQNNLRIVKGGRFFHLMSEGGKEAAIEWIMARLKAKFNDRALLSLALGDGPNDAAMLGACDYGVKIPNAHGTDFEVPAPKGRIMHADAPGPEGWNAAVHNILDDLGFER